MSAAPLSGEGRRQPSSPARVALVTGAARGIGAATVRALLQRGYHVLAVDSCAGEGPGRPAGVDYALADRAQLEALERMGEGRVLGAVIDVTDRDALSAATDLAVDRFGGLDVAVAAAAVILGGEPVWETPASHLRTVWDVDVMGVWNTAAACVPHMLRAVDPTGCRFVALASAAGERGLFHLGAYTMAKHAVVGLVRALAADLVGTGVTAVAVSPGSTRTTMLEATASLYELGDAAQLADAQQLRRLVAPEEVAEVVAFCCSPAGALLNGSVVHAGGGFEG